jgi:hypothetical protein
MNWICSFKNKLYDPPCNIQLVRNNIHLPWATGLNPLTLPRTTSWWNIELDLRDKFISEKNWHNDAQIHLGYYMYTGLQDCLVYQIWKWGSRWVWPTDRGIHAHSFVPDPASGMSRSSYKLILWFPFPTEFMWLMVVLLPLSVDFSPYLQSLYGNAPIFW